MAKTRDQHINKIKKTHSWIVVLAFLMLSIVQLVVVAFFMRAFIDYVINFKLLDQYDTMVYMAHIYETEGDSPETYKTLDISEIDYLIKDDDGTILYQKGENTCGDKEYPAASFNDLSTLNIYLDTDNNVFYINQDNIASVRYSEIYRQLIEYTMEHHGENLVNGRLPLDEQFNTLYEPSSEEEREEFKNTIGGAVYLPLWLSFDIGDTGHKLVGKAIVTIDLNDWMMILGYLSIVVTFSLFVFIMILIIVFSNFHNSRRTLRIFFTDPVTCGYNWLWYTHRGEHLLKSRLRAKNNYAIVNLVFVKYRNYCVCHSIPEGEKLLKAVYEKLSSQLGGSELLAHVTSSNYALLLKYKTEEELKDRLNRLLESLKAVNDAHEHVFTFQAGVDLLPALHDGNGRVIRRKRIDIEDEYNNACTARNSVANRDESCVAFFDQKLVEEQKWLDRVEEEQYNALANEEFLVYYQPKYDPSTDELKGAEALVRWQSKHLGFVSPGQFIPIFEKNGFITELDHYMIRHAARDQKKWLDMGLRCVPVSVNVSRAHFVEEDLAEQIRDIVDSEGAPRHLIEIELTESAFFDDKNALLHTVTKLHEYGFAISMDDFGSGYSSLNSLKDMPLDVLKIDAEFFRGENAKDRGKVVVSETIRLAKSLDMRIVAEGVETKDTVDFLADQDCDMIQGYYYSKPLPKDEYENRMKPVKAPDTEAVAAAPKKEMPAADPAAGTGQTSQENLK